MRIDVLTLFPEMFENVLNCSMLRIAREKTLVQYNLFNIRDYAENKRCVDDRPYGGGAGMVMKPEPVFNTVETVEQQAGPCRKKILLTPQGVKFNQQIARELSRESYLMLICGHYEGVDERIRLGLDVFELSIGDYIMSGGEIPAMVVIDAVVRLIPGVLGDSESVVNESFADILLEYPQYTRPAEYIKEWQRENAVKRTIEKRPDILKKI